MSRRPNVLGLALVALAVGGVLVVRSMRHRSASEVAPAAVPAAASVVLIAPPDEADSTCGCGEIIRMVRAVAHRGVALREIDPDAGGGALERYRVTVLPTVLFLDAEGRETRRFEGEDDATVKAIRAALGSLA